MDNLTHSLFALTLARTPLGRAGRGTTAALVLASNAPDIDIIATAGGGASYLHWHRGPTHGLLGIVGLGVVVASVVWGTRWIRDRRGPPQQHDDAAASFGTLLWVAMVGVVFHVLMDFPTSYGTRLLSPFDWRWFTTDWIPIIDIYLLVILAAGLLAGTRSNALRRRSAALVLVLMIANYGIRAAAHHEALALAPRAFGPALPPPCDPGASRQSAFSYWPRAGNGAMVSTAQRCLVDLAAMPTFVSPFEWRIIAQLPNTYEIHDIDLFDRRLGASAAAAQDEASPPRTRLRYPNQWNDYVATAARTRLGQVFLGFSRFPAARSFSNDKTGETIVRWTDMRFVMETVATDQPAGRVVPFTATVRLDRDGRVIEERLGR